MNDKLLSLIHTLSKSEKRYFKLYAKRYNEKDHQIKVLLFDLFVKLDRYEENHVLKQLGKEIDKNRLRVEKVQLYQLILASLRDYHSGLIYEHDLSRAIENIRILSMKGQFKAAQKIINKYKKIIQGDSLEEATFLLQLLELEKKLVYQASPRAKQQEQIQEIVKTNNQIISLLFEGNLMTELTAKTNFLRSKQLNVRNPNIVPIINSFLKHPLLAEEATYIQQKTQHNCLRIRYHMAFLLKDFEGMISINQQIHDILPVVNPNKIITIINYTVNIVTKLDTLIYAQKDDLIIDLDQCLKTLYNIPKQFGLNKNLHNRIYIYLFGAALMELQIYINHKLENRIQDAIKNINHKIIEWAHIVEQAKKDSNSQNLYFEIYHNLSKGYFILGNYSKALEFNYHILNLGEKMFIPEDYRRALLFSLLIHFEVDNYRLLPYQIDKLMRLLKRIDAPFLLEKNLGKYLKKASSFLNGSREQKALFKQLSKQIKPLLEDPFEQFEQFDFDYWQWVTNKHS